MKNKIDMTKVLTIVASGLAIAGTLLSNKIDSNNRKAMKSELKDEIIKEIINNTKES